MLEVHFPEFQHSTMISNGGWFHVGLWGYTCLDHPFYRDQCHILPIGYSEEDDLLLINLANEKDLSIYLAKRHDLEATTEGKEWKGHVFAIFDDYTFMWDHIRAIGTPEGIVKAEGVYAGWPPYDD
ncbi:MAG: hypothetical protein HN348_32665 [Proteobacteria bacterium]|nr:hypothetical protein [Pseudomonadota bacterium]